MTKEIAEKNEEKKSIRSILSSEAMKKQFALALPTHLSVNRFVRIALTALTKTPRLMECTQESLFACLLDLSQLGLEPDGRMAHLIPYRNKKKGITECTLIIDYKGLVEMARRSNEISDIHADIVCENDEFEFNMGKVTKHIRNLKKERGKMYAAYSKVVFKDGMESYEVMSKSEIDAIRARSKASESGPWVTDYNEMAKKTVFRRHSKWLPVSSEKFQMAMEIDRDIAKDIGESGKPKVKMPKEVIEAKTKEVTEEPKEKKPKAEKDLQPELPLKEK